MDEAEIACRTPEKHQVLSLLAMKCIEALVTKKEK